jgi:glucosylceramidase
MKSHFYLACISLIFLAGCSGKPVIDTFVSSTSESAFVDQQGLKITGRIDTAQVEVLLDKPLQTIEGFGGCFNELGWQALQTLNASDRESILKELFEPGFGASFNICRMPVGANDFSIDWYSYNETPGDFEMRNFNIDNDKKTLIPFIKEALNYKHDLFIWASPWSPPSWMKHNEHYASRANENSPFSNGLSPAKQGYEGTDMFKVEPEYLETYALYFQKFIDSYRKEGINIRAVAPQNEFNSAQVFPSCTWTAASLNKFVGRYLGPKMKDSGVDIWFGTMERPDPMLVDTLLQDSLSSKYIKAVTFQWAGKGAIAKIHSEYPNIRLVQSESECGDGMNDWKFCMYTWALMKHYFSNGASIYEYWNIALQENGLSRWGWRQNSLVTVNAENATFQFNHEYYLMKHFSHFIKEGAKLISSTGKDENLLAFRNPDNSIVLLMANTTDKPQVISINLGKYNISPKLGASSINTILFLPNSKKKNTITN